MDNLTIFKDSNLYIFRLIAHVPNVPDFPYSRGLLVLPSCLTGLSGQSLALFKEPSKINLEGELVYLNLRAQCPRRDNRRIFRVSNSNQTRDPKILVLYH